MHTPGPWAIGLAPGPWAIGIETDLPDSAQIIDADGWHLATVTLDPVDANARLIAAAPDLLAALEAALIALETPDDLTDEERGWVIEDAADAIRKAIGENK